MPAKSEVFLSEKSFHYCYTEVNKHKKVRSKAMLWFDRVRTFERMLVSLKYEINKFYKRQADVSFFMADDQNKVARQS